MTTDASKIEKLIQESREIEAVKPGHPEYIFRESLEIALETLSQIDQHCQQVIPNSGWMYLAIINDCSKFSKQALSKIEKLAGD